MLFSIYICMHLVVFSTLRNRCDAKLFHQFQFMLSSTMDNLIKML